MKGNLSTRGATPGWETTRHFPLAGVAPRRRTHGVSFAVWMPAVVSMLIAVGVAYAGATMARMGSAADLDEPVEIRVIESDLAEPFIVCTIRPRVTRCKELDLKSGQP